MSFIIQAPQTGAIHSEQAYAQSKMLNHSGWHGFLPRNITPSDIDMAFDNNGHVMFCELSRQTPSWGRLSTGQQRIYQELIRDTRHCAVLVYHEVPRDKQIDTANDVVFFSAMVREGFTLHDTNPLDGSRWQTFVRRWFDDPFGVRAKIIEMATQDK